MFLKYIPFSLLFLFLVKQGQKLSKNIIQGCHKADDFIAKKMTFNDLCG